MFLTKIYYVKLIQKRKKTHISFLLIKHPNNVPITDKSSPLFTLAQDALEKQRREEQQHDITQKVSYRFFCTCLLDFLHGVC
jgi:hypothetical protein